MQSPVNLLDCNQEPTDEQLEGLMRAVMVDVRERAVVANRALMDAVSKQIAQVQLLYEFPS
jgi:hypothetical protein